MGGWVPHNKLHELVGYNQLQRSTGTRSQYGSQYMYNCEGQEAWEFPKAQARPATGMARGSACSINTFMLPA